MLPLAPGLGFLSNAIIDQHFSQRQRLGRLISVIAGDPFLLGVGIDEDTALVVGADGVLEVVGSGAVTILDGRRMTLSDYNEHARNGEDPEFHKQPPWVEPQDRGPWGAYDLTLGKAMYAGFTMGGLRVDLDGRVQRPDLSVIDGLYAAGACAVNIAQDGKGYASGTQLAEGSYFGRRAGRHAASLPL